MMLLGGELKRRERLSARLGDVLSNLYRPVPRSSVTATSTTGHMTPLLTWAMEESLGQAERAMDELLNNFPNKVLGCLLRVIVFPFGRRQRPIGQARCRSGSGDRPPKAIRPWKSCSWVLPPAVRRRPSRICSTPAIC
jgi:hypothetical protein